MQTPNANTAVPPPVTNTAPSTRLTSRIWWLLAALLAGACALLFFFNPAQHSFYPFCVFHRITGWDCPGCGGLRAVHQLLHGNLLTAFRLNPLVVAAAPVVVALGLWRWLRGPARPVSHRTTVRWMWVVLAVVVTFWILRNLPLTFFTLPGE